MSTATTSKVVANVISVSGEAFVRSTDGVVRRLAAGDAILEGEIVFTLANGHIELAFQDGHIAAALGSESYMIGPETMVATSPDAYEAAITAAGEVGRVVQALEEGGDILEGLEAPAAGAGAENSGNSFVRLLRIVEPVTPVGYEYPINAAGQIRAPEGDAIPEEEPGEPEEPENGFPSARPVAVILDDEGLHGVAGGTGDVAGEAVSANAYLPFSFGPDGAGDINFSAMHGTSGMLGTETVTYSWDDENNVLTASSGRGDIFTVTVDPATGEYSVALLKPVLHSLGDNENDATVALTYTVIDGNGDSVDSSFTLTIDDDAPLAGAADTGVLSNEIGNILVGDLNILSGADKPLSYVLNLVEDAQVMGNNGDPLTSGGDPLTWHYDSGNGYWVAQDSGEEPVFTVQVTPDGTYTVHLVGLLDGAPGTFQIDLSSGVRGGNTYDLALFDVKADNHGPDDNDADNDGVADNASHMIFVRGVDSEGELDTVNSSVQGMGVGQGDTIDNPEGTAPPSEILTMWFATPQSPLGITDPQTELNLDAIGKTVITLDQLSEGETAYWSAYLVDESGNEALVGSGSVPGTGSGSSDASDETLTIEGIGDFNKLVFTASDDGDYRIASVASFTEQEGYDNALTLPVLATDADGDTVSTSFDVWFSGDGSLYGSDYNDVLVSGSESESLYGGAGDDTLTGGDGGDTFTWLAGDEGTEAEPAVDVITDWGNGTDALDLSDLLQAESSTASILDGHLSFSLNGDGHTEIAVSSAYGGPVVQTIVLEGIDLVTGFADDQAIIQHLLDNGKLITD
jgi:hypothetical protein